MQVLFNYTLVRERMYDLNLTQQKLANYLNENGVKTSIPAVQHWFRKDKQTRSMPDISRLVLISRLLNLDINDLILIDD